MRETGIGTSLMLLTLGAILAFAVNYQTSGIDINAVGWILMLVGLIGLLFSFVALNEASFFSRRRYSEPYERVDHYVETPTRVAGTSIEEEEEVVEREAPVRRRRVIRR